MPGNAQKPLKTGNSRVFLIQGGARPDHRPEYMSSLRMTGLSQNFGDITKIEGPDPDSYGAFIEIDRIRGAVERAATSLVGHYALNLKSRLLELARQGCPVDLQLHMGECTDPSAFNIFSKGVILEDVALTNHSTDDLGALGSGENAAVNETGAVSAREYYEVLPLTVSKRADDIITNQLLDVCLVDTVSCGSCGAESDGCQILFAISKAAGGSPSTPADILFSQDGGVTWIAHDVDTLPATDDPTSVIGIGDYVVTFSKVLASYGLYYAAIQDFKDGIDPLFTKVTTGFNTNGLPNHAFSLGRKAFIVGTKGYVYYTEDPTSGVTLLDGGVATSGTLNGIHALDSLNALAVGDGGAVIYTRDRVTWNATASNPVAAGVNLTSCYMKDLNYWIVTASNGKMFYTLNAGKTWREISLPGTAPSKLTDVFFAKNSVGYASGVVSSKGRMYRSFDGGFSWVAIPESGTFPSCQEITSLIACKFNPNFVVGVGLGAATDGVIVLGKS